jgi:hypothetical protein
MHQYVVSVMRMSYGQVPHVVCTSLAAQVGVSEIAGLTSADDPTGGDVSGERPTA